MQLPNKKCTVSDSKLVCFISQSFYVEAPETFYYSQPRECLPKTWHSKTRDRGTNKHTNKCKNVRMDIKQLKSAVKSTKL